MGEPHQLTHISTEADNVTWSPDGKHILFTSSVYPECSAASGGRSGADEDACDKKRDDVQEQSKVKAKIFTALLYRHWNAFTDDKRSHLFLAFGRRTGSFRDLNPGDTHDVPPFSLGEPDGWDFSPDGREIAFEEKKVDDPALSTNVDIFTLRLFDDLGNANTRSSAGEDFNQPGRGFHAAVFAGWEVDRVADAEAGRVRERSLPAGGV